jgi:beta-glucosidase-like glycosyl hydrolase
MAQQYGQVIGTEEFGKGASANLGPTVNIDRDPRWGRSFEALSEDPFLNASLDVPEIDGVQSQDVMSQVKHFDAYNQETYRNTSAATVQVQLSASGDETLADVQLALQLPQGWTAVPVGQTEFTSVAPGTALTATFQVTPPSYAVNASAVVHVTATMGNMTREAGVTVTVS